ncbi:serine carboxypeptidase [Aureococcus anophagefferens]|nr:serine carboxypeptidase [Aureococcus anophagefferens]
MLFIEQPAGVGFSTGAMDYYDDGMVARDNANFVARWRQRFPDFAGRTLYLTSESYGGHYLPTLALELVKRGTPNRGFAVGNPLTWMPYRDYGQWGTWAAHQLLPLPLWESYLENACAPPRDVDCPPEDPHCEPNATCVELEDTFSTLVEAADPYALDFPTCLDGARAAGRRERHALLSAVSSAPLKAYEPCASDYGAAYLNDPKVRAAIHVSSNATWGECSDAVSAAYNFTDAARPMMPVLVYSGDDDSICATMGSQRIWSLGRAVLDEWAPRLLDGQLAGYTVKFEGLTFETIHGAGHMCPATQPARTFDVLRAFLAS